MNLLKIFKHKKSSFEGNFVIDSRQPYNVGVSDYDGLVCYKAFTAPWSMTADREHEVLISVKVSYDENKLYQLDLYLPGQETVKIMENLPDCEGAIIMASLWLVLDNNEFFIIFPEFCDYKIDENGGIVHYHLILGDMGYFSAIGDLRKEFSFDEICRFVIEYLTKHNLITIIPKVLQPDNEQEGQTVIISTKTKKTISKAVKAIEKEIL